MSLETSAEFVWLGHSAFRVTTPAGKVIYIDPFLKNNSWTPEKEKQVDQADMILLTHGHEDHVGDTLEIARKTGCKVVAQVELSGLLKKHGLAEDQAIEFNKGGSILFDELKVTLVSANHSSSFGGEYAGEAGGLVLTFGDDITFYHMGDTNIFADLEIYGELYMPDLVAVPMGDYYTMGPAEAAWATEMVGAEIAVPIHYGTFPVLNGNPTEYKERVEELCDTEVLLPEPGESIFK